MHIENHKEEVPFAHYEALFRKADPAQITARLGHIYRDGAFHVTLLGTEYSVSLVGADVSIGPKTPPLPVQTFLLRYLLEGKRAPWNGSFKTFREMPWGEMYITPYTGRVLTRAAWTFGPRIAAFRAAAEKIGGTPVSHGDAGYCFQLLPGMYMQLMVWEPDDEFPPNAQVLYSDNFEALAAEDRVVAGDILISALKANM